MTGRRGLALLVAAALLAAATVAAATTGTLAAFTDQASVQAGGTASTAFTSGGVSVPATPTLTQPGGGGTNVTATWPATAVTSGGGGTTATRYDLLRYTAATGGAGTAVCSGVTTTTCSFPPTAGTFHYAVVARFATSWSNETTARRSFAAAALPLTVAILEPGSGPAGNAQTLKAALTCADQAPGCGTSTGATAVDFTLRWNGRCWTGAAWQVAPTCAFVPADGVDSWTIPGQKESVYQNGNPGRGSYTLTVRATGAGGGTATASTTFTIS